MARRHNIAGLRWRKGYAYYERQHSRLEGGRITKALGTRDETLAIQYAGALNNLCDRGDWSVLARWRRDELHVTDIVRAMREGEYGKLRRLTAQGTRLGEAVQAFMARAEATLKPNTAKNYRAATKLLLEHFGADYPMADLTSTAAGEFLYAPKRDADAEVWTPRTQTITRTIYKSLWKMVIENEAEAAEKADAVPSVTRNPWKLVKVPKARQTRNIYLQPHQWKSLITHPEVAGTREAALLGIACLAGLRQQEIAHLRTHTDIDLLRGVIRVSDRKGAHEWTTKHEHSQREVPIVPELRSLLEQHIQNGYAGKYFFRSVKRDEPISAITAQKWTARAFKAAGIRYGRKKEALTLHSLRHTFASWMASAGVPFHVIAELMGNTSQVVMSTYSHLAPSDKARAMQVISEHAATNGKRPERVAKSQHGPRKALVR